MWCFVMQCGIMLCSVCLNLLGMMWLISVRTHKRLKCVRAGTCLGLFKYVYCYCVPCSTYKQQNMFVLLLISPCRAKVSKRRTSAKKDPTLLCVTVLAGLTNSHKSVWMALAQEQLNSRKGIQYNARFWGLCTLWTTDMDKKNMYSYTCMNNYRYFFSELFWHLPW